MIGAMLASNQHFTEKREVVVQKKAINKPPKGVNSYHFNSDDELISVNSLPEIIGEYSVIYALNFKNAIRKLKNFRSKAIS